MPCVDRVRRRFPSVSGSGVPLRSGVWVSRNVTPGVCARSAMEPSRREPVSGEPGKAIGAGVSETGNATGAGLSAEGNETGAASSELGKATGAAAGASAAGSAPAPSRSTGTVASAPSATGKVALSADFSSAATALASSSRSTSCTISSVPTCASLGSSCPPVGTAPSRSNPVTRADLRCAEASSVLETWSAHISANTPPWARSSA